MTKSEGGVAHPTPNISRPRRAVLRAFGDPRYFGGEGSSATECAEVYHGPVALSEPEAANIAHLATVERSLLFAIDSHSHGRAVFRPNPAGGTYIASLPVSPADEAIYAHLESRMVDAIACVGGMRYSTGSTSNHAGTTDEYLFFDHHIFCFDLECGEEFQPPIAAAITAAQEVAAAVRSLGSCAAGETGLDITALLQQRTTVADRAQAPSVTTPATEKPWYVEALPENQWPRLLVYYEAGGGNTSPRASAGTARQRVRPRTQFRSALRRNRCQCRRSRRPAPAGLCGCRRARPAEGLTPESIRRVCRTPFETGFGWPTADCR